MNFDRIKERELTASLRNQFNLLTRKSHVHMSYFIRTSEGVDLLC